MCTALRTCSKGSLRCRQLDGKTKLGAVNCDEEKQLCSEFGIQGFPTLKFFGKNKSRPSDYEGGREAADMVSFCTQQWSKNAPPPEVRSDRLCTLGHQAMTVRKVPKISACPASLGGCRD